MTYVRWGPDGRLCSRNHCPNQPQYLISLAHYETPEATCRACTLLLMDSGLVVNIRPPRNTR